MKLSEVSNLGFHCEVSVSIGSFLDLNVDAKGEMRVQNLYLSRNIIKAMK
jgi:hypothetical protein